MMSHYHPIYDSDKHFLIDTITRDIINESSKITIMQYDHNSERFTFEIPRLVEGHDMSLCNSVRIHFINIGSAKADSNYGIYEVDDLEAQQNIAEILILQLDSVVFQMKMLSTIRGERIYTLELRFQTE